MKRNMKTQKTWFITGASSGFGMEITKAVLASGDKVVATVRSHPEQLANEFNNNADLFVVTMDVTRNRR
jgi:NADP-dependent 3-hydroxy acid dehydrogenase YdfG